MIILRFGKTKVAKEEFHGAKKPSTIQDVDVDDINISKFGETKSSSNHLIEYLDEIIRPLVLIMRRMI